MRIEPSSSIEEVVTIEMPSEPIDFLSPVSIHVLEDARDTMIAGAEKSEDYVTNSLKSLAEDIEDIERMVGTILNSHGGRWSAPEEDLFLRIAIRKGWPVDDENVKTRLLVVASRLAEEKGAADIAIQRAGQTSVSSGASVPKSSSEAIERIRAKMTEAEQILTGLR
jgi:hypothetical protein